MEIVKFVLSSGWEMKTPPEFLPPKDISGRIAVFYVDNTPQGFQTLLDKVSELQGGFQHFFRWSLPFSPRSRDILEYLEIGDQTHIFGRLRWRDPSCSQYIYESLTPELLERYRRISGEYQDALFLPNLGNPWGQSFLQGVAVKLLRILQKREKEFGGISLDDLIFQLIAKYRISDPYSKVLSHCLEVLEFEGISRSPAEPGLHQIKEKKFNPWIPHLPLSPLLDSKEQILWLSTRCSQTQGNPRVGGDMKYFKCIWEYSEGRAQSRAHLVQGNTLDLLEDWFKECEQRIRDEKSKKAEMFQEEKDSKGLFRAKRSFLLELCSMRERMEQFMRMSDEEKVLSLSSTQDYDPDDFLNQPVRLLDIKKLKASQIMGTDNMYDEEGDPLPGTAWMLTKEYQFLNEASSKTCVEILRERLDGF